MFEASFVVMALSIVATYYNNYRKRWVFIVWAFTNLFWIVYDTYAGLYGQAILFCVYFLLAIHGIYINYRKWK